MSASCHRARPRPAGCRRADPGRIRGRPPRHREPPVHHPPDGRRARPRGVHPLPRAVRLGLRGTRIAAGRRPRHLRSAPAPDGPHRIRSGRPRCAGLARRSWPACPRPPRTPPTCALSSQSADSIDTRVRYLAHHYARYLGDLSGGQAVAVLMARHYGATPEQLCFYDFAELGSVVDAKREYHGADERSSSTRPRSTPSPRRCAGVRLQRRDLRRAPVGAGAPCIRTRSAIDGQLADFLASSGAVLFYLAVWGLVFVGTALFVGVVIPFLTGDSLLFAAGIIAGTRRTTSRSGSWRSASGIAAFAGDQVGFWIGRRFGKPALDEAGRRVGAEERSRRTERFYELFGWWSVVIGRYIPWGRVFIAPVAGHQQDVVRPRSPPPTWSARSTWAVAHHRHRLLRGVEPAGARRVVRHRRRRDHDLGDRRDPRLAAGSRRPRRGRTLADPSSPFRGTGYAVLLRDRRSLRDRRLELHDPPPA